MADLLPEQQARRNIDAQLSAAGWCIQSMAELNLGASLGVAVREFPVTGGEADYILFVDRKAVGVVEAKPEGTTLSGVAEQSERYGLNFPADIPHVELPLRFAYESTGVETNLRDNRDPLPRSRRVYTFHRPGTLHKLAQEERTLRAGLARLNRATGDRDRAELKELAGGAGLPAINNKLLDAIDPDKQIARANDKFDTPEPTQAGHQTLVFHL